MKYRDRIYGELEIKEPVILDIIKSKDFQRLKGIEQAGYFEPFFPGSRHFRYEHSMGVFIILKKFGASLEEQIAGLIHDVSHSVFSHCIDYVLKEGSEKDQSHQDNIHDKFIRDSEIGKIIRKYDLDLDYILDESHFPLKETDLPDLCADRLDYSLREFVIYKELSKEQVNQIITKLKTSKDKKWYFESYEDAKFYTNQFYMLNEKFYCGIHTAIMYKTLSDYLKYALDKEYIGKEDLYKTDDEVLRIIKDNHSQDSELLKLYRRVQNKVSYHDDPKNYESEIFCKSRNVDSFFKDKDGNLKRVSDRDDYWKILLPEVGKPKRYFLRFDD